MKAILATTYFGPLQWYQKLNRYENIVIEQHDNFVKQTYRNRCVIATTQGLQALTIPVERPSDARLDKTQLKDVCISDHGNWRHLHWMALQSAYGESPFKVHTARVRSLSIMLTIFVLSLKRNGNICLISIWR